MEKIKEFQVKESKKRIEIYQDIEPESPREWDNLGNMICFHRRYNLGDKTNLRSTDFNNWDEVEEYLIKELKAVTILPLYLYDHSGITISTNSFGCRWDSGQIGFIYATKEDIRQNFQIKKVTKKHLEKTEEILKSEIITYDQYLTGDVYGYKVFENNEEFDSCWGFYGDNINSNGMLEYIGVNEDQIIEI